MGKETDTTKGKSQQPKKRLSALELAKLSQQSTYGNQEDGNVTPPTHGPAAETNGNSPSKIQSNEEEEGSGQNSEAQLKPNANKPKKNLSSSKGPITNIDNETQNNDAPLEIDIEGETLKMMLERIGIKDKHDKLVSNQLPSSQYEKIKRVAEVMGVSIQTVSIAMVNYFIESKREELTREHKKKTKNFL